MSVFQTSVRAATFIYCFVPHSLNKFVQLGGKLMRLVTSCTRLLAVASLCCVSGAFEASVLANYTLIKRQEFAPSNS